MSQRPLLTGLIRALAPRRAIRGNPALRSYVRRLRAHMKRSGVDAVEAEERAFRIIERFVVATAEDFSHHFTEALTPHIEAVLTIRGRLDRMYDEVVRSSTRPGATSGGPALGGHSPDDFARAFDDLETHMSAIEGSNQPMRSLQESPEIPVDNIARVADDVRMGRDPDLVGTAHAEIEPDLRLDDPDEAAFELGHPNLSPAQVAAILRRRQRLAGREWDRARRALHGDRRRAAPESAATRARAEARLDEFRRLFPPTWDLSLHRVAVASEAIAAQVERLSGRPGSFLTEGYEVRIVPPGWTGGRHLRPDDIRMLDLEGRSFELVQHKEPQVERPRAWFDTQEGRDSVRADMLDDASLVHDLAGHGCRGVVYSSGQRWHEDLMAEILAEIRQTHPELGRLITIETR